MCCKRTTPEAGTEASQIGPYATREYVAGMTSCVLVHGNPETPAVWDPLREHLDGDDVVALQLPGFGAPTPDRFEATKEEYVDWLVDELEAIGEPVDLVGHDWGGGFVLRVACTRPDLIRSWVSDVAGLLDPEYVWHDFAQIWQSPAGEQWVTDTLAQPTEERVATLEAIGIPRPQAIAFTDAFDDQMGRCILALYRSAAQPALREWGRDAEAAAARPGLVISPSDDPFTGGSEFSERASKRLGARFELLEGSGHWWMLQDPARGASLLTEFWATLPS
jgi:pimeloyl-ACP methyl ester carboxylesterase